MRNLIIDLETRSDKDIMKFGVYAYTDSKHFDILLFSYSIDDKTVQVIDLANGEKIPDEILRAFTNKNINRSTRISVISIQTCNSTFMP